MLKEVLTVSALIAVVLLVRAIFKNRVPKRMLYALWLVVLLKLCLPGTLVSLPVLPAEDAAVPAQSAERPVQTAPVIQRPAQTVTKPQTPAQQPVSPVQETAKPAAKPLTTAQILQIAWFSGSALLGLWLFGTWLTFTIRLRKSRKFLGKRGKSNIYVSKRIKSPCLAGLIPAVYLTEDVLRNDTTELIVRHELTHLHHLDFLWSLCRTIAVIVYWWNPLIWLAAICSKRDAELACDEAVAAKLPESKRLAYARAILAQAPRKTAALSLAGPPVKERILFLTKKQRTSAMCIVLALLLVVSATGCSFADLTRKESGTITLPETTPVSEEHERQPPQNPSETQRQAAIASKLAEGLAADILRDDTYWFPLRELDEEKQQAALTAYTGWLTDNYDALSENGVLDDAIRWELLATQNGDGNLILQSDDTSALYFYYLLYYDAETGRVDDFGIRMMSALKESSVQGQELAEATQMKFSTYFRNHYGALAPLGIFRYGSRWTLRLTDGDLILDTEKADGSTEQFIFTPDTGLVHRSGAEADFSQPLQAWELTNACGVQTGMTQVEVENLVGKLSPGDTGNRLYDEQNLAYRFWDRSGGEPKLMEMEWNAAVENDEIVFETAQDAPSFRGICLGDTIDTVLEKFPCADRELKNQQSQTLYGQDGDADYASLHLIADSYYSLSFYVDSQWRASIDFSRVQQRVFRIVIYGDGYWQPGE